MEQHSEIKMNMTCQCVCVLGRGGGGGMAVKKYMFVTTWEEKRKEEKENAARHSNLIVQRAAAAHLLLPRPPERNPVGLGSGKSHPIIIICNPTRNLTLPRYLPVSNPTCTHYLQICSKYVSILIQYTVIQYSTVYCTRGSRVRVL